MSIDDANRRAGGSETNPMGLAGFIVSLVGFLSCGLLSPIGLIMSLVGLGRQPKGFAIAGVVLGALGSCGIIVGLLFFPIFLFSLLAAVGIAGGAAALFGPRVESAIEMGIISGALEQYYDQHGAWPASLSEPDVRVHVPDGALMTDPWGNPYVYRLGADGQSYELFSMGPDGVADTADDLDEDGDPRQIPSAPSTPAPPRSEVEAPAAEPVAPGDAAPAEQPANPPN